MRSFAFLLHPSNSAQLRSLWPWSWLIPLKDNQSIKVFPLPNIPSSQGKVVSGYLLGLPLVTQQLLELKPESLKEKLCAAVGIAKRLNVAILGISGMLSSLLAGQERSGLGRLEIPLTNGNVFTAWSVFEAVYRIAKLKGLNLSECQVCIIAQNKQIGSLCAHRLAAYTKNIILADTQENLPQALEDAQIVINADTALEQIIASDLKSNVIICNILPCMVDPKKRKLRPDITFMQAGLIKLPYSIKLAINLGLPRGIVCAALGETLLLALEERFSDYSLGENINPDKVEEIADIAVRHGFEVWLPEAPVL
jgi:predicted amino acid dehydrogenase